MINLLKERCIVYDNSKEQDILNNLGKYKNLEGFIVNNWLPLSPRVVNLLKMAGVKRVYLKINAYCNSSIAINELIDTAHSLCFDGVAIDGEAYSDSKIWSELNTHVTAEQLGRSIRTYCKYKDLACILLPEQLGSDKYKTYDSFIEGLDPQMILMERSYNVWKPWELIKYWNRNKDYPGQKVMGIWQDSFKWYAWPCRVIQLTVALILSKDIFWYTERKI